MQIVALDKTGTLTRGEPEVTDVIPVAGIEASTLLEIAFSLENKSEHPLAGAIVRYGKERKLQPFEVTEFQALPGNGLSAVRDGAVLIGGNLKYVGGQAEIPASIYKRAEQLAEEGKTPLFFAENGKLIGFIAVADVLKEDSTKAVDALKNMGLHVVMLTGDNERTANAVGRQAGVDEVIAGVLPDGKESVIRALQDKGKVVMVGDGINDAPALTRADIGMAIGAGTDIAIDAADVVLMKSSLSDVAAAIRLSRATLRNIHENLFWAFIYNIIGIPLAAGLWIPIFHWQLNPMFGAAAMSLSSFCVVTNALRLNLVRIHDAGKDKIRNKYSVRSEQQTCGIDKKMIKEKMEESKMTKTMKIEGMMCGHCEARVKKSLEALQGVTEALVSHEAGTAVVTLNDDVSVETLTKAVEDQDYKVVSVE